MSVQPTWEHEEIRRTIKEFVKKEVMPRAHEADEKEEFQLDIFRKLGQLGFVGMTVSPDYGGGGTDLLSVCIVAEELSYGCTGTSLSWGAHDALCVGTIERHASEEHKKKYLPKLCSGEWIGCFGLTEHGAGSDATNLKTTAVRDGDEWVLNGSKMFITNAPVADVFVIIAVTDKNKGTKGISAFIIEKGTAGLTAGKPLKKMGMRASPTSEVFLDDCRIPHSQLMGREGEGIKYALTSLDSERAFSAAMAVGVGRRALDESVTYGMERVQFGQPIANFQQVQYMLAEMATAVYGAECMMYDILRRVAAGQKKMSREAAMVKLYCGQMLTKVTLDAIQIHGGYGYMRDFPVERLMRDAKLLEIGGGTNEIQRLVIARSLMQEAGVAPTVTREERDDAAAECIDVIRRMPEGFVPERAAGIDGTLQLDIQGAGKWTCRVRNNRCEVAEGEDKSANAVISTDAKTWVGLSTGAVEPMGVFMSGALRVQGDVATVMKIMRAFNPLKR